MVHALAADDLVAVAERPERLGREIGIAYLGFLQAQDVGALLAQELLDDGDSGAHGIDVPRRDLEAGRHGWDVATRTGRVDVQPRVGGACTRAAGT